jgi:hypothetical protein
VISWAPIVDGVELIDTPEKLWEQGKINPVTGILLGKTNYTDAYICASFHPYIHAYMLVCKLSSSTDVGKGYSYMHDTTLV